MPQISKYNNINLRTPIIGVVYPACIAQNGFKRVMAVYYFNNNLFTSTGITRIWNGKNFEYIVSLVSDYGTVYKFNCGYVGKKAFQIFNTIRRAHPSDWIHVWESFHFQ